MFLSSLPRGKERPEKLRHEEKGPLSRSGGSDWRAGSESRFQEMRENIGFFGEDE